MTNSADGQVPQVSKSNSIRDIDSLLKLSDKEIQQKDTEYLVSNKIDELLGQLYKEILINKPGVPVQFLCDLIHLNVEEAVQDSLTHLPKYRAEMLEGVFDKIRVPGEQAVSHRNLEQFLQKHGASSLSDDECQQLFQDFKQDQDNLISRQEFIQFMSAVSKTLTRDKFQKLIFDLDGQ